MNQKYLTVKELPETERPYEKCEKYGAEALSNAELLAVIIRTGTREERSVDVACRLLNEYGSEGNLAELEQAGIRELSRVKGIGRVKAIQILCAAELGRRMVRTSCKQKLSMTEPKTVAEYYMPMMKRFKKETAYLLHADAKCRITGEEQLSIGTVNSALISPREIFLSALERESVYLILLHNHPSGDPSPSKEDLLVTKRILDCGKLIGIELMDHIIIGDVRYFSMKENGYM